MKEFLSVIEQTKKQIKLLHFHIYPSLWFVL